MTREWFLLEATYQNQSVSEICADALFALEQLSSGRKKWDEKKISMSIDNCKKFLQDFSEAVKALTSDVYADLFLFHLADEMIRVTSNRPEVLSRTIEDAIAELSRKYASRDTLKLLSDIADTTQQKALSKWKLMKPVF